MTTSLLPGFSLRLLFWLLVMMLLACRPAPLLVRAGLITPTPMPDPFLPYRAVLQPWAQGDIEAYGPFPTYHITARLDSKKTTLIGIIRVTVPNPGQELVFRLYPNLDHYEGSITVTGAQIEGVPVEISPLADDTAIRLPLPTPVTGTVTATLSFATQLGQIPFSTESYALFGWAGDILSLPGFYPTLAVRQAGAWVVDQPPLYGDVLFNEMALYQLDLTLPPNLVVAASGVALNVIDTPEGNRTWQISGGPLRDMTVIAGPFQAISESAAGATVTSYYLPGHEAAAQVVLAHATASLRLYSDTYGPYPYTELDLVEAPLNVRGMEYSGLTLLGTALYEEQREFLTFLVAHEVGHQWWYGLVGSNPYRAPWLDEGLTEYGAFDYYRGVFGRSQAEEILTGRWYIPFGQAALGGMDGAVDQPAVAFDPMSYELLVYTKAALFFNALREQLGEEIYKQVIQSYYAQNRYRIATPETFLAIAQRISGQNLEPLIEKWLR